ncbi:ACT domain-containing protein [Acuticoccus sp. MNP-M23]|uniref:ACT domain-containing protein n=1 Tax=Acuticoccus sp. MNP-M23 TaxID=3072793 RepID=UPI00281640D4|nr:ACT domain-containing protein [Acuticoccus sp. MNP-M23]WMS42490.1 ACT domain-containing protein [Acuticoccus sp. MNP-M23]
MIALARPSDLGLTALSGDYGVARLADGAGVPGWLAGEGVFALVGDGSLTAVCRSDRIPAGVEQEGPWAAFRVTAAGALDAPGVVRAVTAPVAEAGLGIFVLSTFERDVVLVKTATREAACAAWADAGFKLQEADE